MTVGTFVSSVLCRLILSFLSLSPIFVVKLTFPNLYFWTSSRILSPPLLREKVVWRDRLFCWLEFSASCKLNPTLWSLSLLQSTKDGFKSKLCQGCLYLKSVVTDHALFYLSSFVSQKIDLIGFQDLKLFLPYSNLFHKASVSTEELFWVSLIVDLWSFNWNLKIKWFLNQKSSTVLECNCRCLEKSLTNSTVPISYWTHFIVISREFKNAVGGTGNWKCYYSNCIYVPTCFCLLPQLLSLDFFFLKMPIISLGCKRTSKKSHSYAMASEIRYIMSSASFASEVM